MDSIIARSIAPLVAVISSPDVDSICAKNGLSDLAHLLRPWAASVERVSIRNSQLATNIVPSFPLRFGSLDSLEAVPATNSPSSDVDRILDSVGSLVSQNASKWEDEVPSIPISNGDEIDAAYLAKSVDELTPWYPLFRDVILNSRPISEHETFNHPACIVLAISSSNRDPMNAMARLYERSNSNKLHASRPYMDPTVLRFFLVVHDNAEGTDLEEAHRLTALIKRTYGPHASLLCINSLPLAIPSSPLLHETYLSSQSQINTPLPPDAHTRNDTSTISSRPPPNADGSEVGAGGGEEVVLGSRMTDVDVLNVKVFLRELIVQSLIPFMERSTTQWNELYASSRRGITGRLFGAGRKFFGSSRPASPGPAGNGQGYNASLGYYPYSSPEAVSRRLADFAFILRDYRYAASIYDSIRKDYATDKAWKYQAGANEMFGLSLLMQSGPRPALDLDPFLEQAVLTYSARGVLQLDSMRSTLLYYEGYRSIGDYQGAVVALLRAAGDVEEIPSAILLEQAALSDLRMTRPAMRRYAFHLVMSAQRYDKCGQKSFSRRCSEAAILVYRSHDWSRAQIHVEHNLGRQAYTMGQPEKAVQHFVKLLQGENGAFLDDFVLAFEQLASHHPEKVQGLAEQLPQPVFDVKSTKIRPSGREHAAVPLESTDDLQVRFETALSTRNAPAKLLREKNNLVVALQESLLIELVACNPLDVQLSIGNLSLESVSVAESSGKLEFETIPELVLEPFERRTVYISAKAIATGRVRISHVTFAFHNLLPIRQSLERRGDRLHATKAQLLTPTYAEDASLTFSIIPPRPNLVLEQDPWPAVLGLGEFVKVKLELRNVGGAGLRDLYLFPSDSSLFNLQSENDGQPISSPLDIPNHLSPAEPIKIPLPSDALSPDGTVNLSLNLYGSRQGEHDLLLMLAYRTTSEVPTSNYASTEIRQRIKVEPVVSLSCQSLPSKRGEGSRSVWLDIGSMIRDEIIIDTITAVSPTWQLDPSSREKDLSLPPLQSGSSYRTTLSVSPRPADSPALDLDFTANKLRRLLFGSDVSPTLPSSVNLAISSTSTSLSDCTSSLFALLQALNRQSRLLSLAQTFPLIPSALYPRIFTLYEPRSLDLLVSWRIPAQNRHGQSVLSTMLGPSESIFLGLDGGEGGPGGQAVIRSMFEETETAREALVTSVMASSLAVEQNPVRITVECPSTHQHDFNSGPSSLPVRYRLSNSSTSLGAQVIFAVQDPTGPSSLSTFFSGDLIYTVQIPPSRSINIDTALCLVNPGAYVVSQWRADVETFGYDREKREFRGQGRERFQLAPERREVIEVERSSSL